MGVLELIEQRRKYGRLGNLHLEIHTNKVELTKDFRCFLESSKKLSFLEKQIIKGALNKSRSRTKNLFDIVSDGEKQDDK